ncbi:MAG: long-chain fatty acid transport protein [Gallionellaceae bacterium]|nr:MAG: long-chain fatty acid transport protein [Gallionellaceae bacterium]
MQLKRTVIAGCVMAALAAISGNAAASGFALIEQSASGLGNAYAGGAASAEDASTIFFNPAGMSLIKGRQLVLAGHAIKPSAKLTNQGSTTASPPAGAPVALGGGDGGDAGDLALVPNLYYLMDVNQQVKFGFAVNVPFGLKTEYDNGWVGRYQALKSEIQTINLNPSVSYKVNETVSLGAGVSYQYIKGELTKAIDFGSICTFAGAPAGVCPNTPQLNDGVFKLTGNDWSWGYNLGALFQVGQDTRVGVAYRSRVDHELSGDATYTNVPVALAASPSLTNTGVTLNITMPETLSVSAASQLGQKWTVMGDVTRTGWSKLQELRVRFANGAADNVTPENWKDTYRFSVGATYQYNDVWKSRIGVAFDQTPVPDQYRTPRVPDNDRTWLSFGASCKASQGGVIDFGYAHLFVKDAPINKTEGIASSLPAGLTETLRGNYNNSVDILSVQYTHSF